MDMLTVPTDIIIIDAGILDSVLITRDKISAC